jgi:hypothetical protein
MRYSLDCTNRNLPNHDIELQLVIGIGLHTRAECIPFCVAKVAKLIPR